MPTKKAYCYLDMRKLCTYPEKVLECYDGKWKGCGRRKWRKRIGRWVADKEN